MLHVCDLRCQTDRTLKCRFLASQTRNAAFRIARVRVIASSLGGFEFPHFLALLARGRGASVPGGSRGGVLSFDQPMPLRCESFSPLCRTDSTPISLPRSLRARGNC